MSGRIPPLSLTLAVALLLFLPLSCQGPVLQDQAPDAQATPPGQAQEEIGAEAPTAEEAAEMEVPPAARTEDGEPGSGSGPEVEKSTVESAPTESSPVASEDAPDAEEIASGAAAVPPAGTENPEAEQLGAQGAEGQDPEGQGARAQDASAGEAQPQEAPAEPVIVEPEPAAPRPYQVRLEPGMGTRFEVGSVTDYQPVERTYTLTNDSPGTVSWSATTDALWVQPEPASGDLEPDASVEIVLASDYVGAEASGPGHHPALLEVTANWTTDEGEEGTASESRRVDLLVRSASPIGINLPFVADFSSQLPFRNLFLQASAWIPQDASGEVWNTGAELDLDNRGWVRSLAPGAAAGVMIAREIAGRYPGGAYVLEYEGKGVLETDLDARIVGGRPGRLELAVTPSNAGIHLKLVDTDPEDPLRNIRLMPAAWEDDLLRQPFHPDFLEALRPFGVLRFAAWQRTNNSPVERWLQRPRPVNATQTGPGGVSLELMIMLCNELHVDPWFCMPHRADDEYIRRFASSVRDFLDPDLKVWVEFSNEVWNPAFQQHADLVQAGLTARLSEDPLEAALLRYAQRSLEVFRTWQRAFDGQEERLVRVVSGQVGSTQVGQSVLSNTAGGVDVYALAPWFGSHLGSPDTQEIVSAMSVAQLLDAVASDASRVLAALEPHAQLAERAGLRLVAFEGGQHLVGEFGAEDNADLTRLFQEANRAPRMGEIYDDFLTGWRAAGGAEFFPFQLVDRPTRWGSWGLLEYQDQVAEEAPKYKAITSFAFRNPRWW